MTILWLKALHVIFMVTWFAGLFYLPRLFVYHSMSRDTISIERFKIMERKLYFGIATPGMLFTILFGLLLLYHGLWAAYKHQLWLHVKLAMVVLLFTYHLACGYYLLKFKHDANKHGHVFYRIFNEISVILLIIIVVLVMVRPF